VEIFEPREQSDLSSSSERRRALVQRVESVTQRRREEPSVERTSVGGRIVTSRGVGRSALRGRRRGHPRVERGEVEICWACTASQREYIDLEGGEPVTQWRKLNNERSTSSWHSVNEFLDNPVATLIRDLALVSDMPRRRGVYSPGRSSSAPLMLPYLTEMY
jgi:hypothetical protein